MRAKRPSKLQCPATPHGASPDRSCGPSMGCSTTYNSPEVCRRARLDATAVHKATASVLADFASSSWEQGAQAARSLSSQRLCGAIGCRSSCTCNVAASPLDKTCSWRLSHARTGQPFLVRLSHPLFLPLAPNRVGHACEQAWGSRGISLACADWRASMRQRCVHGRANAEETRAQHGARRSQAMALTTSRLRDDCLARDHAPRSARPSNGLRGRRCRGRSAAGRRAQPADACAGAPTATAKLRALAPQPGERERNMCRLGCVWEADSVGPSRGRRSLQSIGGAGRRSRPKGR